MKSKIILLFFLYSFSALSQGTFDPYFYQDILNTYLRNPGFTGIMEHPTLSFITHQEPVNAYLFGVSYQQCYDDVKGALGVSYFYRFNDVTSGIASTSHTFNAQYSPCFKLSKDVSLKPGVELGVVIQRNKLLNSPYPFWTDYTTTYLNSNLGFVFFGKDFHVGVCGGLKGFGNAYAADIPGYPPFQQATFSFDFAANINSQDREKTWTVTPNIFYMQNQFSAYTIAGVTFHYLPLLLGLSFETNNTGNFYYIPMVGTWNKYYRISFSYNHQTAKFPGDKSYDYLELMASFAMPSGSHSTPPKFSRIF